MPKLSPEDLIVLSNRLDDKKLTPIIGDRVFSHCLPGASELADAWNSTIDYPYTRYPSIGRLARFVGAKTREPRVAYLHFVKEHLAGKVDQAAGMPKSTMRQLSVTEMAEQLGCLNGRQDRQDPLPILANLPLPIFITTSYYTLLERELVRARKKPESAICYWRKDLKAGITVDGSDRGRLLALLRKSFNTEEVKNLAFEIFGSAYDELPDAGHGSLHRELIGKAKRENMLDELLITAKELKPRPEWGSLIEDLGLSDDDEDVSRVPSIFLDEPDYRPSPERPLVFHLYGIDSHPASLVLTEDDYIDLLMFVSRDRDALPAPVRKALSDWSLVLLGYELHDLEFIILFRGLIASRRRRRSMVNLCIQQPMAREDSSILSDRQEEVESFFERYLDRAEFSVYWGGPDEFLAKLQDD